MEEVIRLGLETSYYIQLKVHLKLFVCKYFLCLNLCMQPAPSCILKDAKRLHLIQLVVFQ